MRIELPILALNAGLGNVAQRPTSDLRWRAHEEPRLTLLDLAAMTALCGPGACEQ